MAGPAPQPPSSQGSGGGTRHSTAGIVSLIFGILQFVALPLIGAIVALVAGYSSRNEARQNPAVSDDLGRVGRILGWIGLALTLGGLVIGLLILIVAGGLGLVFA